MRRSDITVWIQDRPGRSLTLEWHDPVTGQRRQRSAKTDDYEKAEGKRRKLQDDLREGTLVEPDRTSWESFRDAYRDEHLAGLRARSRETALASIDAFAKQGNLRTLADADAAALSRWAASMQGAGLRPWTRRNRIAAVRAALRWAVRRELLKAAPAIPTVRVPQLKPEPVAEEAFERLLAAEPDAAWRAFYLCGWLAGLRLSEALQLRRERSRDFPWVDWQGGRIELPATFVKAASDQSVPLHPALRSALEELPAVDGRVFAFDSAWGGGMTRHGAGRHFAAVAKRAGVRLSMHKLRKGFGSRLAARVPAAVLQSLMRHSSITVTMQFYANADQAAALALESLPAPNDVARDVARTMGADPGKCVPGAQLTRNPKRRIA